MVNESDRMALFAISMLPSRRVAGTPLGTLQDVEGHRDVPSPWNFLSLSILQRCPLHPCPPKA